MSIVDCCKTTLQLLVSSPNNDLPNNVIPILQYFNNSDCKQYFLSSEQGSKYSKILDSGRKANFSDASLTFLEENAVLVCLGVVIYGDLQEFLRSLTPFYRDQRTQRALSISYEALLLDCEDLITQFSDGLHASEKRFDSLRDECHDVVSWFTKGYIQLLKKEEEDRVIKVAAYLPGAQQMWCYLFSYVHNASEIFALVSGYLLPKRKLIWRCTDGVPVDFETWRILSQFLPHEMKHCATVINDFKTAIYSPESRHVVSVYGPKEIKHGLVSIDLSNSTIIQQLVCMCLENWDEIWFKSRWPRHPELLKRLQFYRLVYRGRLDPKIMLSLLFQA